MPDARFAAAALTMLLCSCDMAPHYQVPATPAAPTAYKETGAWSPAAPGDEADRSAWWRVVSDRDLDDLEHQLLASSPDLATAVARYDLARALSRRAGAALLPQIDGQAGAIKERTVSTASGNHYDYHDYTLGGEASYEADIWGRVRNLAKAGRAEAQASRADVAATTLSLQAELADTYLQLRGLDAQIALLRETIEAYSAAQDLTQKLFLGGAASELDLGRARTQLGSAQSELEQRIADRALLEHAIAALVGRQASSFALAPSSVLAAPPRIPLTAPSLLLQRRPDVAAAERRVAAANARIGVARAAFYPNITLGASGGFETTANALVGAGTGVWALGPASALLPIFDGGRRKADVAAARAEFAEAAAAYRRTTLNAFRDVEDQLALVNRLSSAASHQRDAVEAAARTNQLAGIQYQEGAVDYLQVVSAQTAELQARQVALQIQSHRLMASIDLVRSLGGGWQNSRGG
jgi:outer membrane protein, multidrug efflux system